MFKFKEYFDSSNESAELDEALNLQQRMKAKQNFRKNKAKIAIGRKKAEKKIASPEKLMDRAMKAARKMVEKKLLQGKSKDELTFAAREALEKKLESKKGLIKKLAKKLLPKIKEKERNKRTGGDNES